jgi:hypothetical protein
LETGVECDDDEAFFRKRRPVDFARSLLLAAADGVRADDYGVLLLLAEFGRQENVGGNVPVLVLDLDGLHDQSIVIRFNQFDGREGTASFPAIFMWRVASPTP